MQRDEKWVTPVKAVVHFGGGLCYNPCLENRPMMYEFMELPDKTEITHSDMRDDGTVKVCVERPVDGGFKTAYCELPSYPYYDRLTTCYLAV